MRTRRSPRNQDILFRELFAPAGARYGLHKSPRRKRKAKESLKKCEKITLVNAGVPREFYLPEGWRLQESPGSAREALSLCLQEIEQFHRTAYPACDGGCPAHEAINAARRAIDGKIQTEGTAQ